MQKKVAVFRSSVVYKGITSALQELTLSNLGYLIELLKFL